MRFILVPRSGFAHMICQPNLSSRPPLSKWPHIMWEDVSLCKQSQSAFVITGNSLQKGSFPNQWAPFNCISSQAPSRRTESAALSVAVLLNSCTIHVQVVRVTAARRGKCQILHTASPCVSLSCWSPWCLSAPSSCVYLPTLSTPTENDYLGKPI